MLLKSLCLSSKAPQGGIDGRTRRPGLSYCHIDFGKKKKLFIAPRSSKRRAICTPRVGISRMYAFRAHISKEHKTERHRIVPCRSMCRSIRGRAIGEGRGMVSTWKGTGKDQEIW